MIEIRNIYQNPEEPERRWFADDVFDLLVWFSDDGLPLGFQLCYHRGSIEKAMTWLPEMGYSHKNVDGGECNIGRRYKMTPVLVPDGIFEKDRIITQFEKRSSDLDPAISRFVLQKLAGYDDPDQTVSDDLNIEFIEGDYGYSLLWENRKVYLSTPKDVFRFTVDHRKTLLKHEIRLLGALAYTAALHETRWAPDGETISAADRLIFREKPFLPPSAQSLFINGINMIRETLIDCENHDSKTIFQRACKQLKQVLGMPLKHW